MHKAQKFSDHTVSPKNEYLSTVHRASHMNSTNSSFLDSIQREEAGRGSLFLFRVKTSDSKEQNLSMAKAYKKRLEQIEQMVRMKDLEDQQKSVAEVENDLENAPDDVSDDYLLSEIQQIHLEKERESLQKQSNNNKHQKISQTSGKSLSFPINENSSLNVLQDTDGVNPVMIPKFHQVANNKILEVQGGQESSFFDITVTHNQKRNNNNPHSLKLPRIKVNFQQDNTPNVRIHHSRKLSQGFDFGNTYTPKISLNTKASFSKNHILGGSGNYSLPTSPVNQERKMFSNTPIHERNEEEFSQRIQSQFDQRFKLKDYSKDHIKSLSNKFSSQKHSQSSLYNCENSASPVCTGNIQVTEFQSQIRQKLQQPIINNLGDRTPCTTVKKSQFSKMFNCKKISADEKVNYDSHKSNLNSTQEKSTDPSKVDGSEIDLDKHDFDKILSLPLPELAQQDTMIEPTKIFKRKVCRSLDRVKKDKLGENNQIFQNFKKKWQEELYLVLNEYKETFIQNQQRYQSVRRHPEPKRMSSRTLNMLSFQHDQANRVFKLIEKIEQQQFFKNISTNQDGEIFESNLSPKMEPSNSIFSRKRFSNDDSQPSQFRQRITSYGKWYYDPEQYNKNLEQKRQEETELEKYQRINKRIRKIKENARKEHLKRESLKMTNHSIVEQTLEIEDDEQSGKRIQIQQQQPSYEDIEAEIIKNLEQIAHSLKQQQQLQHLI